MRSLSTSTAHVDASSSSSAQASALTNTLLVSKAITRIPLTDSQLDQFPGPTSENLWSLPLTRLETLVGLPLSAFFDPHPGSSQIDESLTFLSSSTVSLLLSQSESLNRSFSAANSTAMFVTPGSSTVESVPNGSTTIVISSSSKTNGNQATTTLTSTSTYRPSESASSEPITASTTVVMATSIDGNTLVRSSITTISSILPPTLPQTILTTPTVTCNASLVGSCAAPTHSTQTTSSNASHRAIVVGSVVGAISAVVLVLAVFMCYHRRVLCFRKKSNVHDSPYEPTPWSEDTPPDKRTGEISGAGSYENFPALEIGEPGPAFTADDLAHMPSDVNTLRHTIAARATTPTPAPPQEYKEDDRRGHVQKTSDTTIASSVLSDPFRTPPAPNDTSFPRTSAETLTSTTSPPSNHQPSASKIGLAITRYSTHSIFNTQPPRPISPTQPCPLIPSQILKISNSDNHNHNRNSSSSSIHSTASTTATQPDDKTTTPTAPETLYIGKARPINFQSFRRHSLTPRVINIVAAVNNNSSSESVDLANDGPTLTRRRDSVRARSASPLRSSLSLYSGSPAKLDRYFDIRSHAHSLSASSSQSGGGAEGAGEGAGAGAGMQSSKAYNDMVAAINRRPTSSSTRRSRDGTCYPPTSYSDIVVGRSMSQVKRAIREQKDRAFGGGAETEKEVGSGDGDGRLPDSVVVVRGGGRGRAGATGLGE